MLRTAIIFIVSICFAGGCATSSSIGTDGVVRIGPDIYMLGGLGDLSDRSGSAVKARFYQVAEKYCLEKSMVMYPANSTAQDATNSTYASAEIQFKCLDKDNPRLK